MSSATLTRCPLRLNCEKYSVVASLAFVLTWHGANMLYSMVVGKSRRQTQINSGSCYSSIRIGPRFSPERILMYTVMVN